MVKAKKEKTKVIPTVEICRSFSKKLNLGNFSNADFFCSAKMEVSDLEMVEMSEKLFKFVQDEVEKSERNYQLENMPVKELTNKEKIEAQQIKTEEANAELGAEAEKENENIKEAEVEAEVLNELANLIEE